MIVKNRKQNCTKYKKMERVEQVEPDNDDDEDNQIQEQNNHYNQDQDDNQIEEQGEKLSKLSLVKRDHDHDHDHDNHDHDNDDHDHDDIDIESLLSFFKNELTIADVVVDKRNSFVDIESKLQEHEHMNVSNLSDFECVKRFVELSYLHEHIWSLLRRIKALKRGMSSRVFTYIEKQKNHEVALTSSGAISNTNASLSKDRDHFLRGKKRIFKKNYSKKLIVSLLHEYLVKHNFFKTEQECGEFAKRLAHYLDTKRPTVERWYATPKSKKRRRYSHNKSHKKPYKKSYNKPCVKKQRFETTS